MQSCLKLAATIALSVALYLSTFLFLVEKPLTIGFMHDAFNIKHAYAVKAESPKIVVVAGSGALFGIRCQELERLVRLSCVNGAITGELGLSYSFDLAKKMIRSGDVVILPLEFGFYGQTRRQIASQRTHPYRVHYDLGSLMELAPGDVLNAVFQFDLRYLLGASVEMSLAVAGISRRFSRQTLTANGDMRFHSPAKGETFRAFIEAAPLDTPRAAKFDTGSGTRQAIADLAAWATERNVRLVGTLPPSFDDRPIDQGVVDRLQRLFRDLGLGFFVTDNLSQYPRHCFYDSPYHLNEQCQKVHTRHIAYAIKPLLPSRP